jgi:hypothetical protein
MSAVMLMEERDSSAAKAIEALRARKVIGTAIANFLNIVEYLFSRLNGLLKVGFFIINRPR